MRKFLIFSILSIFTLVFLKPVSAHEDYLYKRTFSTPPISFKYQNGIVKELYTKVNSEPPFSLPFINIKIPIPNYLEFKDFSINRANYRYIKMALSPKFNLVSKAFEFDYSLPDRNVNLIGEFKRKDSKFLLFRYYPIIYKKGEHIGKWLINFELNIRFKKKIVIYENREKEEKIPTYLIIGRKDLKEKIEFFIDNKKEDGFNVVFIPLENFGSENVRKNIRDFIKEKYETMNIKYLLLIGTTEEIPMFEVFPHPNGKDSFVKTDFFYGELDSNINFDGDDYFGEPEEDRIDFYSEVGVGRIPETDPDVIVEILKRTIMFKNLKDKSNVLLAGGFWNFKEKSSFGDVPETDGAYSLKVIFDETMKDKGFVGTFLSEKEGVVTSKVEGEPLTYENFIKYVNETHPSLIMWQGHGLSQGTYRKVWIEDKNKDGYFQNEEGKFVRFVDVNSIDYFDKDFSSITFMGACDNMFDVEGSLAHIFLKSHSVSVIASTDTAWYGLGWNDLNGGWLQSLMYKFSENLSDFLTVSDSLNRAKEYYFENLIFPLQKYERYQNIYVFNILGDPSISLKTPEESISIVSNKVKVDEGRIFNIEFSSSEDISSIKGYIEYNPEILKFFTLKSSGSLSFKELGSGRIMFNIKNILERNLFTLTFFAKRWGNTKIKLLNIIIDNKAEINEIDSEKITIEKRKYPIWDINLDGVVDGEDLIEFSKHFGSYYPEENYLDLVDFTMDGVVDGEDLIEFSTHFGETYEGG